MKTDETICLNYFDDNGKQRSLQDRIYHSGGGSTCGNNKFSLQYFGGGI